MKFFTSRLSSLRRQRRDRSRRQQIALSGNSSASGWLRFDKLEDRTLLSAVFPMGEEHLVNTQTVSSQQTSSIMSQNVAIADNGNYVVTWMGWAGLDQDGWGVYAQLFDSSGAKIGGEILVNSQTIDLQENPTVSMAGTGEFIISWSSRNQDGDGWGIYAQRFDKVGNTLGPEIMVNTETGTDQRYSSVAMADSGQFVVSWSSLGQDGDGWGVYAQWFNADGSKAGNEIQVNSTSSSHQLNATAAMSFSGESVIAWASAGQDGDSYGIFAQRFDASGNGVGSEFQVNTHIAGSQLEPSIALADSGLFVVSWHSFDQDGNDWGVFARQFDADGNPLGNEFQVNTYATSTQNDSAVTLNNNGDFLVSWTSTGQDGDGMGIFAQRFDANGNKQGNEFQGNSFTTGHQLYSSVSLNDNGDAVIAWTSQNQDGDSNGVYAQRFSLYNRDVTTVGREQQVNTYTPANQDLDYSERNVAISSNGSYVAVWNSSGQDGDSYGVFAQLFNANGNHIGNEFQVNTYTISNQTLPSVAMSETGEFVITWGSSGQDGSSYGIYARRFDAAGNAISGEFQVNTFTTGSQNRPSVAMTNTGEFVIAWRSNDPGRSGIYAQRFDASGNTVDGEFQVNTYAGAQVIPQIAMNDTHGFVISWSSGSQDGSDYGIYAQRYDSEGNPIGDEFQVNDYTTGRQFNSSMAMNNSGDLVITWESQAEDGSGYAVIGQRYDVDGNPVGNNFQVNTFTAGDQLDSSVSMADSGEFVVAWSSLNQDGDLTGIYAQRFDAQGNALGAEFQVHTKTTGHQLSPSVALNDVGQFVVVWQGADQDGSGIFSQRFSLDVPPMVTVGPERQVNTYTASSQGTSGPSSRNVALAANGDHIVVWTSEGQDGSSFGIYAQRFDRNGNTLGDEFPVNTIIDNAQRYPSISMTSTGEFVVAWQSDADGTDDIFARRFAADGTALGAEFRVNTYTTSIQARPSVSMADSGEFLISWASFEQDGSGDGIYAQRYDSDGNPIGGEFHVNTYSLDHQHHASTAISADSGSVITWADRTQDGSSYGIYAQRYDVAGQPIGGEFRVNSTTLSSQNYPSISMNASGEFLISWDSVQDGSGVGVFARKYDSLGTPLGDEFQVNSYISGTQYLSSAAIADTGEFIITWTDSEQDGSYFGAFAQRYDAQGNALGSEFRVNSETAGTQNIPSIGINEAGDVVIVWQSQYQDGDNYGVYAQQYRILYEPPHVAADNENITVDEGDSATNSGTYFDAEGFEVTLSASVGTIQDNGDGTWIWSWDTSDGPDDSQTVTVTATNERGLSTDTTFELVVENVAPVITGVTDTSTSFGNPITISANITDAGIDTPFTIVWDMGDGTIFNDVSEVTHTYAAGGEYFASLTVTDSDGAESTKDFRVVIAPPVTITATETEIAEAPGLQSVVSELIATIENPLSEDVVIPLSYSGTAIPDIDFEEAGFSGMAPTQIVIPAGQTSAAITIRNISDALDEHVESLIVHFGVPSNASLASADPIEIQLLDDDPEPAVYLSSPGQTLDEQDLAIPVTVSLSEISGRDVTVNLTTGGTATLGADYLFDNPVIVIPAGQLSASTVLHLLDDTIGEGVEQIQVQLVSADYATIPATTGQPAALTHIVKLSDTPTMQFASVLKQVSETAGKYDVLLTLSNESTSPITTTITLSGSAVNGDDYTSALGTTFDVTFDPGDTEKIISVELIDDGTEEADENLLFQTTNLLGSTISHQARIIDDDTRFVTVTTSPSEFWEDVGQGTITATLSKISTVDVSIPISFTSDLENSVDFFVDTTPIVIPAGALSATRGLAIVDNDTPGNDEVIVINVGTPENARLIGNNSLAIVVRDDDPIISFDGFGQAASARTISAAESVGTIKIPVFLNKRVNNTIFVPVTVSSRQMKSSEYALVYATVRIDAGEDRGYVEIDITDDNTFESTETLTVKLGAGQGFTLADAPQALTRTVEVTDNESEPVPSWSTISIDTYEGRTRPLTATLRLSHASDTPVDVVVSVKNTIPFFRPTNDLSIDGFALHSSGKWFKTYWYTRTYTFNAYQTKIPIEIFVVNDDTYESTETFVFSTSRAGSSVSTFEMVIRDNDVRPTPPPTTTSSSSSDDSNWYDDLIHIPTPDQLISTQNPFSGLSLTDGYIDGATTFFDANFNQVPDFVDANGNGVFDEVELLEPIAESGYDGFVAIPSLAEFDVNEDGFIDPTEGQFVVRGGVDSSTGMPMIVPLVAPVGYPVVSPLSTLVAAIQEAQQIDTAAAETVVADALSITEPAYLRSHLIPLANNGDTVAAQAFAANAQLYGTASQMAAFISGLQGGIPADLAGRLIYAEIAALLSDPGALLDLTEPVVIDSILRGAISRSGAQLPTGDELSTTVDVIVAINQQLAGVPVEGTRAYLESIAQIQVVANGQAPNDLAQLAAGTLTSA
ncbi:MAG: hypothetical protein CMJ46_10735, partial [Planctomyces sp.]|nr:hypothetical protein [Planctomyces sp.]